MATNISTIVLLLCLFGISVILSAIVTYFWFLDKEKLKYPMYFVIGLFIRIEYKIFVIRERIFCGIMELITGSKTEEIVITNEQKGKYFMQQLEKDYSDSSDKPLLIPQNNREYWLFTEIWQRCSDFFNMRLS